ncbi:MAG: hypothetical protein WBW31_17585 [Candidatus Sulfotelmatobacter sp.]
MNPCSREEQKINQEKAVIRLFQANGAPSVEFLLDSTGRPAVKLANPDLKGPTAALAVDDKGTHVKFDRPGRASSYLFLNNLGESGVVFVDANGVRRLNVLVGPENDARIERFACRRQAYSSTETLTPLFAKNVHFDGRTECGLKNGLVGGCFVVSLWQIVLGRRREESQRRLRRLLLPPSASMIFASTDAAEVNHNSDNQNQQINAGYRLSCIRHPRIHKRGQGQEQKSKQRE